MEEFKPFTVERPWGNFRQLTHNSLSTVKTITVNAREAMSLQSHSKREEFWKVIKGSGIVQIEEEKFNANEGDEYNIKAGERHRLTGGEEGITILEVATGDFDEEDIIRYEDKYGRA